METVELGLTTITLENKIDKNISQDKDNEEIVTSSIVNRAVVFIEDVRVLS